MFTLSFADIAQSVERVIGNDEVPGPNPGISSMGPFRFRYYQGTWQGSIFCSRILLPPRFLAGLCRNANFRAKALTRAMQFGI